MASFSVCQRACSCFRIFLQVGQLFFEAGEPLLGGFIFLFLQGLALDLELQDLAVYFVQRLGLGVDLGAQAGGGFVDQVDGLVGQVPVGDVAAAERRGGDHGCIGDAHSVVYLVALLQAAQDADGLFSGRFANQDRLETTLEGGVFFDVLAVFIDSGGADHVQLAARQHGLEHVAGVHGAFGGSRADHGVHLVDEQDDLPGGVGDLLEYGFEALFELAAVLGAGDESAHVELHQALALEAFGYVAVDHALGQAFDDGGLANAGIADQGGIVLGAAGEDLHDAADFLVATDDRVDLAHARQSRQVAAVFFQRLVSAFGSLGSDALRAADARQGFQDGVFRQTILAEALAFYAFGEAQKDVLGRNVFVLHAPGIALGG